MGINANDLRDHVIKPTLEYLNCWSSAAETLLLATIAMESNLGARLKKSDNVSEGIGIYHIDESTHLAIWDGYLALDPDLASRVRGLASQHQFLQAPHIELSTNMSYATAIAWMIYQRAKIQLPLTVDAEALSHCWAKGFAKSPCLNTQHKFTRIVKSLSTGAAALSRMDPMALHQPVLPSCLNDPNIAA